MVLERTIKHKTRFNGETRQYFAYRPDEAKELGIEFVPWRRIHVPKRGIKQNSTIWVLSDDGLVVPVYGTKFTRNRQLILETPFGHFPLPRTRYKGVMNILSTSRAQTEDFVSGRGQPKHLLSSNIVQMAAHGLDVEEIVSLLCVSETSSRANHIRKYYKSKECVKMVREEVREILRRVGLSEERVVEMLIEAHDTAKEKRDASNMLRATENLIDMYGMKEKNKESVTRTLEVESSTEDLERLERVQERVKIEQKNDREGD